MARNAAGPLATLASLRGTPGLREVRSLGHMRGLEFTEAAKAEAVAHRCYEAGVLVLQAGNLIRINPPLVASPEDLELLVATLVAAVRA